jgi:hypothetical protein
MISQRLSLQARGLLIPCCHPTKLETIPERLLPSGRLQDHSLKRTPKGKQLAVTSSELMSETFQAQLPGAREWVALCFNPGLSSEIQTLLLTLLELRRRPSSKESLVEGKQILFSPIIRCQAPLKSRTTYPLEMMQVRWGTSTSRFRTN